MATRPLRIMHIVHALNVGGMERWIVQFCLWLKRMGHQCSVVCLREKGKLSSVLEGAGIEVSYVALTPGFSSLYPFGLIQHIRKARPDVLHAHSGVWYKSALAARFARLPLIYTQHGMFCPKDRTWRTRFALKCTHTVIAVSADVLASLRSACPGNMKKMQFVPNGVVDVLSIPTEKISAEWSSDMFAVVGMIARFEAPKDYFTVVEAATRVHCVNPATHFVLVGEGPEQSQVLRRIIDLGAKDYVHLLGYRSDVPAILQRMDVFVLSSLSEGASLSLVEAMSAQRPIVATAVGGTPGLLANGECGLLVPPGDPQAMAEAILELLTNKEKAQQLARNARQRFLEHFTIDAMGERYLEVYEQALNRR